MAYRAQGEPVFDSESSVFAWPVMTRLEPGRGAGGKANRKVDLELEK